MPSRNLPLPNILSAKRPKEKTVISLIFLLLFSTISPARADDAGCVFLSTLLMPAVMGGAIPLDSDCRQEHKSKFFSTFEATYFITFHPTTHPVEHVKEFNEYSVLWRSSNAEKICIGSSVPATIYVNKKKVGNTPFCGEIENGLTTEVVLATEKYKPKKVPLEKRIHHDILSSLSDWFDPSHPTTFNRTSANVASSSSPASNDMTMTSQGRWIEYTQDSYFIDFSASQIKTKTTRNGRVVFEWQVRDFALKNFFEIKAEKDEYIRSMAELSGLPEEKVKKIARENSIPESFANEITKASYDKDREIKP